MTFALSNDVANFPMDDIYAIYAGWHAEHPDIDSPSPPINSTNRRRE